MHLSVILFCIIVLAAICTRLSKFIHIPSVVFLICLGLIGGIPFMRETYIGPHKEVIFLLGDIGLLSLMFLAGLESSWHLLCAEKKDATLIAVFGVFVPFVFGFAIFFFLEYSLQTALIIGVCMSISAEATRAKVLLELKKLKTRLGAALIGAGLIDDILGLSLFVIITLAIKQKGTTEELLVVGAIISFFIGILVQRIFGKKHVIMRFLKSSLDYIIIPFFFITIGFHFEYDSFVVAPMVLIVVVVAAFLGKIAGAFVIKPWTSFSFKQLNFVGWAMNSRGALELALALVAFRVGLISQSLYGSLIVMALLTTLSFPFVCTHLLKTNPQLMD